LALVALAWGRDAIPGVPELHPRLYTHATTLLFWVFWFMGLVFAVPVAGRAWCGVCPLGFVADLVGRRGLGLRWPRWVASGAGTVVLFLFGVGAVVLGEVHKSPHRTAVFVGATVALALLASGVFRRSAFCRGLCPVGGVLHLYSRHAPVAIRPRDPSVCGRCTENGCVSTRGEWRRWDVGNLVVQRRVYGGGCPVALYPPDMDPGACLLCLRCVRDCPRGNLGVYWGRKAEARDLDRARSVLLVLVMGLVTVALLRTWPDARLALTPGVAPPWWAAALWLGVALPGLLAFGPAVLGAAGGWLRGGPVEGPGEGSSPAAQRGTREPRAGLGSVARPFLAAFVGVTLGAHAAVALVKLNAKAAYLPYLLYDPTGAATYLAIYVSGVLPVPDLLVPLPVLRWLASGCLAVGVVGGVRELARAWRDGKEGRSAYAVSFAAVSALLGAALVHWLFGGRG
jgi:ferredoxin